MPYSRIGDDAHGRPAIAIVRVYVLPAGFRVLVGRDAGERDRLREVVRRAGVSALGVVVLLGLIGGFVIARRVLKRVDDMGDTTRSIMASDLKDRLPVTGSGDELDRLAVNLNTMLDRIGVLMGGLRTVSDNIAHDLKTPLTRLRNRADAALRGEASPEAMRKALEGVIDDADNLIRVFNALLMIARLEAARRARRWSPSTRARSPTTWPSFTARSPRRPARGSTCGSTPISGPSAAASWSARLWRTSPTTR